MANAKASSTRATKHSDLIRFRGQTFSPGHLYTIPVDREPAAVFVSALGKLDTGVQSTRVVNDGKHWIVQVRLKGAPCDKLSVMVHYEESADGQG